MLAVGTSMVLPSFFPCITLPLRQNGWPNIWLASAISPLLIAVLILVELMGVFLLKPLRVDEFRNDKDYPILASAKNHLFCFFQIGGHIPCIFFGSKTFDKHIANKFIGTPTSNVKRKGKNDEMIE